MRECEGPFFFSAPEKKTAADRCTRPPLCLTPSVRRMLQKPSFFFNGTLTHATKDTALPHTHARGVRSTSTSAASRDPAAGSTQYAHRTSGGADTMTASTRPPSSPKRTPRS